MCVIAGVQNFVPTAVGTSYTRGVAVQKLSVSFEADLADAVREAAAAAGGGLSSWLAEAAAARLRAEAIDEFLADYQRTHGAFTEAELTAADIELGYRQVDEPRR